MPKELKILSDTILQYFIGFVQWFHLPTIFLKKLKGDNFFRCAHELFRMEQDRFKQVLRFFSVFTCGTQVLKQGWLHPPTHPQKTFWKFFAKLVLPIK